MLTEDRCPRCEVERLEKLNQKLRETAGVYGKKAQVRVSYRWRGVFTKLMKVLALPEGEWSAPQVKIGHGSASGDRSVWLPKKLAEELAEISEEMDKEYTAALLRGYDDGLLVVSRAFGSAVEKIAKHKVQLKASGLKRLFSEDKYYRGEFNIAKDELEEELLSIFK